MENARHTNPDSLPSGKERRSHIRYPVSIPVDVMIEGAGRFAAIARDFGLGGFLLAFNTEETATPDSPVENKLCLLSLNIDNDQFRLRARIVRVDNDSIGVAFISPDQIALQALQQHAKANTQSVSNVNRSAPATEATSTNETDKSQVDSATFNKILHSCNETARAEIEPTINQFLSTANKLLLDLSKKETDISIQNTYFRALETFNSNRALCVSIYTDSINASLMKNKVLEIIEEHEDESDDSSASLELVTDEDFDVWLATSKAINKIEAEYAQQIGALEQRLSFLYNQDVDRRNNPFGPALFVKSFQKMLESLELASKVKTVCYDIFKNILLQTCKQLYDDINKMLIGNDILPRDKDVIAYARRNDVDQKPETSQQEDEREDSNSVPDETSQPDEPAEPDNEIKNEIIVPDTGNQQNLYELVGELRNLQQQLRSSNYQATGSPPGTGIQDTPGAVQPSLPAYSTAEVLDLISNIGSPARTIKGDGQSIGQFREKLEAQLATLASQGNEKTLSQQQGRIIDVTENIFGSLLNDMQVAQSVRPWLEQLAVPVMKVALLDDNIFTDKNHIVRNVINKLAELEVLANAQDAEEQAAVRQIFGWVVNLVEKEFDGTTNVYSRAAQQLDLLINVQKNSYERNIKEVITEAIQEESSRESNADEIVDAQNNSWLRMARRLKEEHWVLFEADTNDSKRLKVAWIAPRNGKYVFVNVMGRKERITTDEELAELLQNGSAVVLDGGNDPAMDRAQYSMLQKLHQQLIYQATHDELTGLINRREFLNCIEHAIDDARHSKNKHAICFVDIDNFKVINSNFGFEAGDKLLIDVIEIIQNNLSADNVLARLGADKFALLLQNTSMDDAIELVEVIMDNLLDYRFEWNDNRMTVTLSAGVAIVNASTENTENLLQSAESSCSIAKESGGNQIQIAHSGSSRLSRRQQGMEWAARIDKALEEDALYLRCQKIVPSHLHPDALPHYEILLGISDELGGQQSLGSFIQAAEQHNRMPAVDRWVISNAFKWLEKNEDKLSDIASFSINLSGQSLNNEHLIEFIYDLVNRTTVPIERVCFEVTETAGVSSLSDAADFIETIKGTGCKFALDDFGTGMSSYSYLKGLPVDYLKIDGAFIQDVLNNKNDYAVVKSICEIGHFMEKQIIAEFVQDQQSTELLAQLGVNYLQGYGIEKPHRLDDLIY